MEHLVLRLRGSRDAVHVEHFSSQAERAEPIKSLRLDLPENRPSPVSVVEMFRRAILLLLLATLAVADDPSDVIVLDDYNFDEGVADESVMLVEFYAPW